MDSTWRIVFIDKCSIDDYQFSHIGKGELITCHIFQTEGIYHKELSLCCNIKKGNRKPEGYEDNNNVCLMWKHEKCVLNYQVEIPYFNYYFLLFYRLIFGSDQTNSN